MHLQERYITRTGYLFQLAIGFSDSFTPLSTAACAL